MRAFGDSSKNSMGFDFSCLRVRSLPSGTASGFKCAEFHVGPIRSLSGGIMRQQSQILCLASLSWALLNCGIRAQHSAPRVWTDAKGRLKVTATRERKEVDKIVLRKARGTPVAVPLARLLWFITSPLTTWRRILPRQTDSRTTV